MSLSAYLRSTAVLSALALSLSLVSPSAASAAVDPANMGKGDWIWLMSSAQTALGVSTVQGVIDYEKNKGMQWIVVKCADQGTWMSQFSSDLITRAHTAGLKIFGYQRVWGVNLTAEINAGKQCLASGADGYIIDAEAEFEGKASQATTMMNSLRASYPTAFIAHAPFPYIDYHTSFPYVEFGKKCDAVMPQCYWTAIGVTPTKMVSDLDAQWKKWQTTWTNQGNGAAVKPIVPIGQAYDGTPGSEITTFVNALKNDASPATAGGYKGVSFWSCQHHNADEWAAIGAATIGSSGGSGGSGIVVDNTNATVVGSWDTGASAADRYGSDYRFKSAGTGSAYLQYAPTLTAGSYQVYEWHSQGTNRATAAPHVITYSGGSTTVYVNQQANGGKWNLLGTYSFAAGTSGNVKITDNFSGSSYVAIADAVMFTKMTAPDIVVDNSNSGFTASSNWSTGTSATDKYGADYRYRSTAALTDQASWAFTIDTAGTYDIYAWWSQGTNRSAAAPFVLPDSTTVSKNQQANGGVWNLLGSKSLTTGSKTVKLSCYTTAGYIVLADAIKLVAR